MIYVGVGVPQLGLHPPSTTGPLPGPQLGDGLLLETGVDFLLLESGDFLLLE